MRFVLLAVAFVGATSAFKIGRDVSEKTQERYESSAPQQYGAASLGSAGAYDNAGAAAGSNYNVDASAAGSYKANSGSAGYGEADGKINFDEEYLGKSPSIDTYTTTVSPNNAEISSSAVTISNPGSSGSESKAPYAEEAAGQDAVKIESAAQFLPQGDAQQAAYDNQAAQQAAFNNQAAQQAAFNSQAAQQAVFSNQAAQQVPQGLYDANRVPLNPTAVPFTSSALPTPATFNGPSAAASTINQGSASGSFGPVGSVGFAPELQPTVAASLAPGYPSQLASQAAITTPAPVSAQTTTVPTLAQTTVPALIAQGGAVGYTNQVQPTIASALASYLSQFGSQPTAYNVPGAVSTVAPGVGVNYAPQLQGTIAPAFAQGYSAQFAAQPTVFGAYNGNVAGIGSTVAPNLANIAAAYSGYPTAASYTGFPTAAAYSGYPTAASYSGYPTAATYSGYPTSTPYTGYPTAAAFSGFPTATPYSGFSTAATPTASNLFGGYNGFPIQSTIAPQVAGGYVNPTVASYAGQGFSTIAPTLANGFSGYNNPLLAGTVAPSQIYSSYQSQIAGGGISPYAVSTVAPQFADGLAATVAPQLAGGFGIGSQFGNGFSAYGSPFFATGSPAVNLGYSGYPIALGQNAAFSAYAAPGTTTVAPATTTLVPGTASTTAAPPAELSAANAASQTNTRIQATLAQRYQAGQAPQAYSSYVNPASAYQQLFSGFPNGFGINSYNYGAANYRGAANLGGAANYNGFGLNYFKKKKAAKKA